MCVCARPGGSRSIGRNPDVPGVVRWRGCVAGCLPAVDVCDGVVLRTSFVFTAGETFIDCKLGVCVCREVSSRLTCLCLSVEPHCESVHFIHYKTYRTSPLDAAASMCSVRCRRCGVLPWRLSPGVGTLQALREVGGHHLDNLILFVHGAGNLIFGHAADSNLCKPGAGSYWFEVQVGCCVLCAASRAVVVPHDMDSLCVLCVWPCFRACRAAATCLHWRTGASISAKPNPHPRCRVCLAQAKAKGLGVAATQNLSTSSWRHTLSARKMAADAWQLAVAHWRRSGSTWCVR